MRDAETGFLYLRARSYDPQSASFLTPDPVVTATRAPYGYAASNPVMNHDPLGLYCLTGVAGHDQSGNEICNGASELRDNVVNNRGKIATAFAIAGCVAQPELCAVLTAGALAVRVQQRGLGSDQLLENGVDIGLTAATFGLVSTPASLAEEGGTLPTYLTSPEELATTGPATFAPADLNLAQKGVLRVGVATPDIAALTGDILRGEPQSAEGAMGASGGC
jgi:hypothetical protein